VTGRSQGLLPGTVDVLILRTLAREPMHGYGIARLVREQSGGMLTIESAALYQALHRLERKEWVRSSWRLTDTNRRAKFYQLTTAGRKHLDKERKQLGAYIDALKLLLELS
jgi:transcriptional regulator